MQPQRSLQRETVAWSRVKCTATGQSAVPAPFCLQRADPARHAAYSSMFCQDWCDTIGWKCIIRNTPAMHLIMPVAHHRRQNEVQRCSLQEFWHEKYINTSTRREAEIAGKTFVTVLWCHSSACGRFPIPSLLCLLGILIYFSFSVVIQKSTLRGEVEQGEVEKEPLKTKHATNRKSPILSMWR